MTNEIVRFPTIHPPQVVLVHAETRTGIVLDISGNRHVGLTQKYVIFDSRDAAEQYAIMTTAQNTEIECAIFDHNCAQLALIRPSWVTE